MLGSHLYLTARVGSSVWMPRKRENLPVTVPRDLIVWLDELVKRRRFSTRSHAVEVALIELRKHLEEERRTKS